MVSMLPKARSISVKTFLIFADLLIQFYFFFGVAALSKDVSHPLVKI